MFDGMLPAPPSHDDAEVIAHCAAILRLRKTVEALDHPVSPGSPAERALDARMFGLWNQEGALVRRMCSIRARTWEGHRARAATMQLWHDRGIKLTWADDQHALAILTALVRDVAGN